MPTRIDSHLAVANGGSDKQYTAQRVMDVLDGTANYGTNIGYALNDPAHGGAPLNGVDDTATFNNVWARCVSDGVPLFIPPGPAWHLNGSLDPGAWGYPSILGSAYEASKVIVGTGVTMVSTSSKLFGCLFQDFTCQGGAGLFHSGYTSGEVAQRYLFHDLRLYNYTGCAIANESFDNPHVNITGCEFFAHDFLATIGVAWSGQGDNIVITGNHFNANRIHIKLSIRPDDASSRGPKNMVISDNGFIRTARGATDPSSHSIWVVPGATTGGSVGAIKVSGNKFGSENVRDATTNGADGIANSDGQPDTHVLFADQDAIGSDNTNRFPVFTASTGRVVGFSMNDDNTYNMAGTVTVPLTDTLALSTTPFVSGCRFAAFLRNGAPLYALKLTADPAPGLGASQLAASLYNQTNVFGPFRAQTNGVDTAVMQACNYPGMGAFIDPNSQFIQPRLAAPGGTSTTGYAELLPTRATSLTMSGGSSSAGATDAAGGTDAIEATLAAAGTIRGTLNAITSGVPIWIDFDLKSGATGSPLTVCELSILVIGETTTFKRTSIPITATWQQHRYSLVPRDSRSYVFQLRGPAAGTVQVGRINVYHNREPVSHGPYLIRSPNGTLHRLTVDNTGALVVT